MQIALLNRKPEREPSEMERFGTAFGRSTAQGLTALAEHLANSRRVAALMTPDGDGDVRVRQLGWDDEEANIQYGELMGEPVAPLPDGALKALSS
jgi:hypothetical protein